MEKVDRWEVPCDPHGGTEIKLSHEMFLGILRACGGKLVVNQDDMLALPGETIVSYRTLDPATFVWEIGTRPQDRPPERALEGTFWTSSAGISWRKVYDPVGWVRHEGGRMVWLEERNLDGGEINDRRHVR